MKNKNFQKNTIKLVHKLERNMFEVKFPLKLYKKKKR